MDIYKQLQPYLEYPTVRRNQFLQMPDKVWEDNSGIRWIKARPFLPPFAQNFADRSVQSKLLISPPPATKGGAQFWFLLKSKQSFFLREGLKIRIGGRSNTIVRLIYRGRSRTGLAELI